MLVKLKIVQQYPPTDSNFLRALCKIKIDSMINSLIWIRWGFPKQYYFFLDIMHANHYTEIQHYLIDMQLMDQISFYLQTIYYLHDGLAI